MSRQLHVTTAAAPTLDNTLFVTEDPTAAWARVLAGPACHRHRRPCHLARWPRDDRPVRGRQMELSAETPFVYDGQSLAKPVIDGYLSGWTVTLDEDNDTITAQ